MKMRGNQLGYKYFLWHYNSKFTPNLTLSFEDGKGEMNVGDYKIHSWPKRKADKLYKGTEVCYVWLRPLSTFPS